jgi:glutamate dehydrogenase (NADP+)
MYLLGISVLEEEKLMFGQYKRLRNEFTGNGKGLSLGFINKTRSYRVRKRILRSKHAGNQVVSQVKQLLFLVPGTFQYSTEKATQLGGKVVTMSDSAGYIYDAEGIDAEKLAL